MSAGPGDFAGPDWAHSHSHVPNPTPPAGDSAFAVVAPSRVQGCPPDWLARLPRVQMADCYIVSTGHGVSGPFVFGGVLLADLLTAAGIAPNWRFVDVVSADGFGARIHPNDMTVPRPPLLADEIDGAPMTRSQGRVRLIVPAESDDALRQVKWIAEIRVVTD